MVDVVIAFIAYVCITLRPIVGYCIVKKDNADLQRKLHDLECLRDSRLSALEKEHSTYSSRNRQLLQENIDLSVRANRLEEEKRLLSAELTALHREHAWGRIFPDGRIREFGALTEDQQRLVNYPRIDPRAVYVAPSGKAYHAVRWCYTLDKTASAETCTLAEAKRRGLEPCSKCVAPRYR